VFDVILESVNIQQPVMPSQWRHCCEGLHCVFLHLERLIANYVETVTNHL